MRGWITCFAAVLVASLAACSGTPIRPDDGGTSIDSNEGSPRRPAQSAPSTQTATKRPGSYYLDDGPGQNPPANLDAIPDAVPRREPVKVSTTRPYTVMGRTYKPMPEVAPYQARGTASWYGRRYHGQRTSTGEIYDMYAMTAAHPTLPIPSYVRVTSVKSGRSVVVRVNDRGPFHSDRLIDLSYVAAWKLGIVDGGSGLVDVEAIIPGADGERVAPVVSNAPPPTNAAAVAPGSDSGVFLQLGAFAARDSAEDFAAKMRVELVNLGVPLQVVSKDNIYRVHAGPYVDRGAATRDVARIGERLGLKPFLVVR